MSTRRCANTTYTRAPRPTSSPSDELPKPRWCGDCSRKTSVFLSIVWGLAFLQGPRNLETDIPPIPAANFLLRERNTARTFRSAGSLGSPRWPAIVLHSAREARGTGEWRRSAAGNDTRQKMTNHVNAAPPILLTIAGFDPSCGAGTAADSKTFSAHNCYGVAAITALTVQSTLGVISTHIT